jgi:hypothetical protein
MRVTYRQGIAGPVYTVEGMAVRHAVEPTGTIITCDQHGVTPCVHMRAAEDFRHEEAREGLHVLGIPTGGTR